MRAGLLTIEVRYSYFQAENLATLRPIALNLLKRERCCKLGLKSKQHKAR